MHTASAMWATTSLSGSTSDSSDSYTLVNNSDFVTLATTSETGPNGWSNDSLTSEFSLGLDADGTDSFRPGHGASVDTQF